MRVAILILTLIVGALLFVQTFLVYSLSGVTQDETTASAGAVGLLIALLWLVAAAFIIGVPLIAAIAFVLAGILAVAMAASSNFTDLTIWGVASFVLAGLSFIAMLTKRRGERRTVRQQAERDERLAANIRESVSASNRPGP